MGDNARGAIYMCLSMAAFTLNDSFMKAVTEHLPTFEAAALRGPPVILALALIAWQRGTLKLTMARGDAVTVTLRCLGEILSTATFLYALKHMPLANISAVMQSLPLAVTLAAALFLGEPIGWRRAGAILVGFAGVMLIIRPGTAGFDRWSLLALGAVASVVLRDIASRRVSRAVPSIVVAVYSATAVTLFSALAAPYAGGWPPVSGADVLALLAASACLVVGYIAAVSAMRVGEVGFVAPFRYTSLVWAIALGWLVFDQWPGPLTLVGAAVVIATGLFTLFRERRVRRA
ncbi:DMT family transporter [Solirhodobacter olei]|uniref:DMT family transporter n=1 Tax=Solirhodobacter olei TaxID=2493082 RepID=UPI000FDBECF8|nr:DMT family transporter [Solirhodobacter olei]